MSRLLWIRLPLVLAALLMLLSEPHAALGQDSFPLQDCHVWLPMTGVSDAQMDDARASGYDTILLKIHPSAAGSPPSVDLASTDEMVERATSRGFRIIMAILGWVALPREEFWDTRENGEKIPGRLDPFWPEAMERVEWYYRECFRRYRDRANVVAFVPTWGIYGEAGFTSFDAGRSEHALARFNEWRQKRDLPALQRIPTRVTGLNTDYNLFIQFRFEYVQRVFTELVARLKPESGGRPVGMWQELYPVMGYLWNMVEVPSADFALYESAFTFQTSHTQHSTLAETMGFRYRCLSAEQYRDYYLPLLARKRGEGQRFMGCQLTNDYAVQNYGWSEERARRVEFDRWEDRFGPVLKELLDEPLESPERDVLLVFPTYAAAALSDRSSHAADVMLIDVLLRMYGCQMRRVGSPALDQMSVEDMSRYRLVVLPEASFIQTATWEKLMRSSARVLATCQLARALDGEMAGDGNPRYFDGLDVTCGVRPEGEVSLASGSPLTRDLPLSFGGAPLKLPEDESFRFSGAQAGANVLLTCAGWPLVSLHRDGRVLLLHGHLFAEACRNPSRKPPRNSSGSADASANEVDMWGHHDSADPRNAFTTALMKNILDWAEVEYRVPRPKPRTVTRYLGDHIEQVSISANLVYNNTARRQQVTVRTPYAVKGLKSKRVSGRYETDVSVPEFSYVALQPAQ